MSADVAALILCHNRPVEVAEAVASLNGEFSEVIVLDNGSNPPLGRVAGARTIRCEENGGVAKGRNLLLEACAAPYAVFIDDDAVALGPLESVVRERLDADPNLAVIAFRIVRPDGQVKHEHPFRGRIRDVEIERPCAYFVGAGYAVRTDAVRLVGGYDDGLFYSTEEIDLAMTLLGEGWTLRYVPELMIEHRPSSRGREPEPRLQSMALRNRLVFVRRHLHIPVAAIHGLTWVFATLPDAIRSHGLRLWLDAIRDGLARPVERRPLDWRRLQQIHRLGGRVFF